jgi:Mus7/MMS22 family
MPNHDRQYPKEESIHQRDLASLRNHHDLLCTLYWAAPSQFRPSPTLLQDLVIVDHSHKEACLINLRAWEQLASFVLTHDAEQDAYEPLKLWYQDFFSKLVQQYLQVESEIRDQALGFQGMNQQVLQENQLQEIIMANRETTHATLCTSIRSATNQIKNANTGAWIRAFQFCKCYRLPLIAFLLILSQWISTRPRGY